MNHSPKISLVLPTYNDSQYIEQALNSALNQTYTDFEIIVVDDGSTDNTRDLVDKYGNSIGYIYQENQGLASARNTGIEASKGKFLAFLDADDWFAENNLEAKASFLDKHQDVGWVYSDWQYVDDEGNYLDKGSTRFKFSTKKVTGHIFPELVYNRNFISPCSAVIKKTALEAIGGFDPKVVCQEDWDLWLRLSLKYSVQYIDEVLVFVLDRANSLSKDSTKWALGNAFIVDKIENMIPDDFPERKRVLARLHADKYTFLARDFVRRGQISNALHAYLRSIKHLPYQKRVYWLTVLASLRFLKERKDRNQMLD